MGARAIASARLGRQLAAASRLTPRFGCKPRRNQQHSVWVSWHDGAQHEINGRNNTREKKKEKRRARAWRLQASLGCRTIKVESHSHTGNSAATIIDGRALAATSQVSV
jgi:hypothetical protein